MLHDTIFWGQSHYAKYFSIALFYMIYLMLGCRVMFNLTQDHGTPDA